MNTNQIPNPRADLKKAAEKGDVAAQCYLANDYHYGEGVPRDDSRAVKWWRKAADQNAPEAQASLGFAYIYGWSVPKNPATALQWFQKAAAQNEPAGIFGLGALYEKGMAVPKDEAQALRLYRKSAEQNYSPALLNIGSMYGRGAAGLTQSFTQAANWWRRAADLGNATAMYNLACCYENSHGVKEDYLKAYDLYLQAAVHHHPSAKRALGLLYLKGLGTNKNPVEAYAWMLLAEEAKKEFAPARKTIELALTPEQRQRGRDHAQELRIELFAREHKLPIPAAQQILSDHKSNPPIHYKYIGQNLN